MPKRTTASQTIPPDIQLQNLWLASARSGRFRHRPLKTDVPIRGRYLGLADLFAVYCWLLLAGLAVASAIWLFA